MLKIAIVEDEPQEQQNMKQFLNEYLQKRNRTAEVRIFDDGDVLLDEYPSPDLILLDIEMKRMDGITAAKKIRAFDEHVLIVFVTNMVNRALDGYAVDAADFIIKPLHEVSFQAHMDRALRKLDSTAEKYLELKSGRENIYVNIHDITYIETANRKNVLHKADGTCTEITDPLYQLDEKLSSQGFFRCHSAYLINIAKVQTVSASFLLLGTQEIPISKHRRKEFLTALTNYKGRML